MSHTPEEQSLNNKEGILPSYAELLALLVAVGAPLATAAYVYFGSEQGVPVPPALNPLNPNAGKCMPISETVGDIFYQRLPGEPELICYPE